VGVAIGTLVGSTIGIICNFVYNMPRSNRIAIRRKTYFSVGIARPAICVAPIAALILIPYYVPALSASTLMLVSFPSVATAVLLAWRYGLLESERMQLGKLLKARVGSAI